MRFLPLLVYFDDGYNNSLLLALQTESKADRMLFCQSSGARRQQFTLNVIFSYTSGPIAMKFYWNGRSPFKIVLFIQLHAEVWLP